MKYQRDGHDSYKRFIAPALAAAILQVTAHESSATLPLPAEVASAGISDARAYPVIAKQGSSGAIPRAKSAGWRVSVAGWTKPFRRGNQTRIDACKATLWWGSTPGKGGPTTWLAGHDRCGFWRWDRLLPVGAHFAVRGPADTKYRYRVTGRKGINRQSGSSGGLIRGDLMLQTCRGATTRFVYAKLVSVR